MKLKLSYSMLIVIFSVSVGFADPSPLALAGKKLAQACTACHGENGKSSNILWPNLAGQKKNYLSKQLHDFREGHRNNLIMEPLAKSLSDTDIEALATYFSDLN